MKTIKIVFGVLGLILATSFTSIAQDGREEVRTNINSEQEYNQEVNRAFNTYWNLPNNQRGVAGAYSNVINLYPDPAPVQPDIWYKTVHISPCVKGFKWVTVRIFHEYTFTGWRRRDWRTWTWKIPCPVPGDRTNNR